MPEKWYKSEEIKVDYICDECGKGKMLSLLTVFPGLFPHMCPKCETIKNLKHIYPLNIHKKLFITNKPMTPVEAEWERNEITEG